MSSIYLDTSVISALFDEREPSRKQITDLWFNKYLHRYDVYISQVVIEELSRNQEPVRSKTLNRTQKLDLLPHTEGIEKLAERILIEKVLPAKSAADALHLSYAIVFEIDFLVSWNFKHLANVRRQTKLQRFSVEHGLFITKLVNPMYLF